MQSIILNHKICIFQVLFKLRKQRNSKSRLEFFHVLTQRHPTANFIKGVNEKSPPYTHLNKRIEKDSELSGELSYKQSKELRHLTISRRELTLHHPRRCSISSRYINEQELALFLITSKSSTARNSVTYLKACIAFRKKRCVSITR